MFHVSSKFLGYECVFTPCIPMAETPSEQHYPERVCAAPTVKQCLAGIEGVNIETALEMYMRTQEPFHVYKLPNKGYKHAKDVIDYPITGEVHYYSPVLGKYVGEFRVSYDIYLNNTGWHNCIKRVV